MRELAQEPFSKIDPELARRWIRLCELWTSSAAWLHLHGPLELGVLATLHTRVELRHAGFIDDRQFPYGPFASEAYSIAKTSERRDWQRRRFEAARLLATKQIALEVGDPSGAFGIRASASMQLAMLGRPWLIPQGLRDYRRMWRVRQRIGASESEVGEALVESAYAEFRVGRRLPWIRRSTLQMMREGVALMEGDRPHLRAGFVKRAKSKLADALELAGLQDEARAQRLDLAAFVQAHGLPRE